MKHRIEDIVPASETITYDYLRKLGNTPRLHGNGFIQLDLFDNKRLHFWTDNMSAQSVSTQIHDHRFDLKSYILLGKLIHIHYRYSIAAFEGTYHFYIAKQRKDHDTELVRDDVRCSYYLQEMCRSEMSAGSIYTFPKKEFHETRAVGLTCTLIEKLDTERHYSPRVACYHEHMPDNKFTRYDTDPELLWNVIEQAFKKIAPFCVYKSIQTNPIYSDDKYRAFP